MARPHRLGMFLALVAVIASSAALLGQARAGFVTPPTTLQAVPAEAESYFGYAVASGDVNNDGYDDVIVGSPFSDVSGQANSGEVRVFLGPSLGSVSVLQHPETEDEARFGWSVATGDVNGDYIADVIVGAPNSDVGSYSAAGRVFVFLGPSLTSVSTIDNPDAEGYARFGRSLAAGDVNNDGYDEVIVGAPDSDMGEMGEFVDAGQAFVFLGPSFGTVLPLQDQELESGALFGQSVAAGDVNNDGYHDVIVGAYGSDVASHACAGQVFVFLGPSLAEVIMLQEPVPELDAYFGFAVTAGDVNNDGYEDAVIGVHDADAGNLVYTSGGEAYIFLSPSFETVIAFEDPVLESFAFFARSVAVGDVNNDGKDDFIAGAPWSDVGAAADAGEAFVFLAEPDADGDGVADSSDNCPLVFNPDQLNTDAVHLDNGADIAGDDITVPNGDSFGDACDDDNDNDGLPDDQEYEEACPYRLVGDSDEDGFLDGYEADNGSDPCDAADKPPAGPSDDSDGDGLSDGLELRGWGTDPYSLDSDGDGCDDDKEVGSINDDKQANIIDVLWVAKMAFGLVVAHPALDLDKNGEINILDALLAAKNSTLVEPHGPCP